MKVVDLQGKEHKLNLSLYITPRNTCSSLHSKARDLLHKLFPMKIILEEVPLPGTRMSADFFIPSESLMIEVQGEQHYNFNSFHFANKLDFAKAKMRDRNKADWAARNSIVLIPLPYNEDENEWTSRITKRND